MYIGRDPVQSGRCSVPPTKILVVDDEPELVSILNEWLEGDGYEVFQSTEGRDALRLFYNHRPALVITDLRMPGMDGFKLISRIREISDTHILALTALGREDHIVRGLQLGADEYVVKPVPRREFLARVQSLVRRAVSLTEGPSTYSDPYVVLNFLTHEVHVRGENVRLRPTEFRLLSFMVQNNDRVLRHQELVENVWTDQGGSLDSLKWYISSLREKLEEDPKSPRLILTLPRLGYRYLPPQAALEEVGGADSP